MVWYGMVWWSRRALARWAATSSRARGRSHEASPQSGTERLTAPFHHAESSPIQEGRQEVATYRRLLWARAGSSSAPCSPQCRPCGCSIQLAAWYCSQFTLPAFSIIACIQRHVTKPWPELANTIDIPWYTSCC